MVSIMERKKSILFFSVVWVVLFLSFFGNVLGVGVWHDWFYGFQRHPSPII